MLIAVISSFWMLSSLIHMLFCFRPYQQCLIYTTKYALDCNKIYEHQDDVANMFRMQEKSCNFEISLSLRCKPCDTSRKYGKWNLHCWWIVNTNTSTIHKSISVETKINLIRAVVGSYSQENRTCDGVHMNAMKHAAAEIEQYSLCSWPVCATRDNTGGRECNLCAQKI